MGDTMHLKTNLHETVKQYITYDINGRTTNIYEAHSGAVNGQPCLRTRYTYDGASNRIVKRLEEISTWDSSWDM
jgi:hypothetical protein